MFVYIFQFIYSCPFQDSPVGSAESSGSSGLSSRPLDLGMASIRQQHATSSGSAPTSPKTVGSTIIYPTSGSGGNNPPLGPPSAATAAALIHAANAGGGPPVFGLPLGQIKPSHHNVEALRGGGATSSGPAGPNSKSLPNIPSVLGRGKESFHGTNKIVGRKSPPASSSNVRPAPHHSAMLVRRSKSSAILPLRKHLIEKTLAEQQAAAKKTAMDEEQFYYQQKQKMLAATRERSGLTIRPIEEVMEEDVGGGRQQQPQNLSASAAAAASDSNMMEIDDQPPVSRGHSFAARLGTAGLSPLVLGEVTTTSTKLTQEYLSRLLPTQPVMAHHHSLSSTATTAAATSERSGLGFDPVMLQHECICGDPTLHPENPRRLKAIWSHLVATGLADQCVRVAREATLEEIRSIHSESHTITYGTNMNATASATSGGGGTASGTKFPLLKCGGQGVDSDTYWNPHYTSTAAKMAAGCVIELSTMVRA